MLALSFLEVDVTGLIINLVDSDHRWRDSVVRVSGPWEAALGKDHGRVPNVWNRVYSLKGSIDPQ